MNFLGHYYCLTEEANENIVLGNLLPDILPGFTYFYNKLQKQNLNSSVVFEKQIHNGISAHLKTDALFHEHSLFIDYYVIANKRLQSKFPHKKSYIMVHIMVELMIDRQILKSKKDTALLFYSNLERVEKQEIASFLKNGKKDDEITRFLINFNGFLQNKYAYLLSDMLNIPIALDKILSNRLGTCIAQYSDEILDVAENIEFEMQNKFLDQMNDFKNRLRL